MMRLAKQRSQVLLWLAGFGLFNAGCRADPTLEITLTNGSLTLAANSISAGQITFTARNASVGDIHEFAILRTDLAADQLPLAVTGDINEEAEVVQVIDEFENILPGQSATLSVQLAAGHYVVVCNMPGHYRGGMWAELTVTP